MKLDDQVAIGPRDAPSRVVFGPHETNLGTGRAFSDRHVAYYTRRATRGAGVIVTETASVTANDWPYERAPLASECGPGWKSIAAACRPHETVLLAGLGHAGGQGSSANSQEVMWAPSRVADVVTREPPAELDDDGIAEIVDAFADSARRAVSAGMDGVEIDSGPWSLLRQFQSGLTNLRADAYGQDKLLITRQVISAVRHAVGEERVVALRLSCDELAPWAGITPEQAAVAVAELAPLVDALIVVRGGPYSTAAYRPDAHAPGAFNRELCREMRVAAAGQTAVVLQGSVVDPTDAQAALDDGCCDLVEMTRAQIAEPRLVSHLRAGAGDRIRPCILCNQACKVRDNRNPIVSCVIEPSSGHETEERHEPAGPRPGPSALVVGAGPAGLECARLLAEAGRQVTVMERRSVPGGTPVIAAVGAGRERLRLASDWLVNECLHLGVDIVVGREATSTDVKAAQAEGKDVVVATGSRLFPDRYPTAASPTVIDALSLLAGGADGLPAGPVVIDDPVGDQIGVGVAEWLAASTDRSITLVSPDPVAGTLLARTGDLADANVRLQRGGVTRQLRSRIIGTSDGQVDVEDVWTAEPTKVPAAVIVDCGHRLADDELYRELGDISLPRAGDCVAPRTILEAVLEGRRVALELLSVRQ